MLLAKRAGLADAVEALGSTAVRCKMVTIDGKTAADAARLFKVHPATVSRLLAHPPARKTKHAK
jgi:hypothetical protein